MKQCINVAIEKLNNELMKQFSNEKMEQLCNLQQPTSQYQHLNSNI
jgi:hypothetical protein